jgi:uncharacterized protein (TIGR02145 family)
MKMRMAVAACGSAIIASLSLAHPQPSSPPVGTLADGHTWTMRNLEVSNVMSFCYADDAANCGRYGRLYTWEAARQVCETLGAGWTLPSDADWRGLAQSYGGLHGDDGRLGSEAYDALLAGGRSGFEAVLGGGRSGGGEYARGDAHGFYWTASETSPSTAVFYNFGKGSRGLYRQMHGEKERAFSVRCVKQ